MDLWLQFWASMQESLVETLGSEWLLAINLAFGVVLAAVFLVPLYKLVRDEMVRFRSQKLQDSEFALKLLQSNILDRADSENAKETLQRELFNQNHKINAGPEQREALSRFYTRHQNSIGWHDLQRAWPRICVEDRKLTLELSFWNKCGAYIVRILVGLVALYAAVLLLLAMFSIFHNKPGAILILVLALLLFLAAAIFSTLNWPYQSALKIRKCIASEQAPPASHSPDEEQPTAAETEADTE